MRELKFRAWHNGKMCHFDLFTTEWDTMSIKDVILNAEPIMQYTGLKDKNGVEVYEGDIVRETGGKHIWLYLVTTDRYSGGNNLYLITRYRNFRHVDAAADIEWGDYFVNEGRDIITEYNANNNLEVIGNIHENPELLERKP